MQKMIAIPLDITAPGKDYLLERGYTLRIGDGSNDAASMKELIAHADGILARTQRLDAELLSAAAKLRVIGRHGVGVDNIDLAYCAGRGIRVTNAPESNAVSVAEHTIGLMIGAAHHFSRFDAGVRRGEWAFRDACRSADLDGKTLGLIGLGRIGALVAEKARAAFRMRVLAYRPSGAAHGCPPGVEIAESAEQVFSAADFVSLHCPLTEQTRGMVNTQLLNRMKPTAFLINTSRGAIVDTAALADALRSGAIRGAGLDVLAEEPPRPDSPLLRLPNVLLTPHSAALTQESMDRMGLHAAMGIDDVLSGREPEWPVPLPPR